MDGSSGTGLLRVFLQTKLAGRIAGPRDVPVRRARVPRRMCSTAWGWERCLSCAPAPGSTTGESQGGLFPDPVMALAPGQASDTSQPAPPAPECLVLAELTSCLHAHHQHPGAIPIPGVSQTPAFSLCSPPPPWPLEEVLTHQGRQRKQRGTAARQLPVQPCKQRYCC